MSKKRVVILPHGPGFRFINRVIRICRLTKKKMVVCAYTYDPNQPLNLNDHFPGNRIMPGVLHIEAAAEAAIQYLQANMPDFQLKTLALLTSDNCRYKRSVRQGDEVIYTVTILRLGTKFGKAEFTAKVGEKEVATGQFSFGIFDKITSEPSES